VEALISILWGYTSQEYMEVLEKFFPQEVGILKAQKFLKKFFEHCPKLLSFQDI